MISLTQYVQSDNDHTCYYQASSSFGRVQRVEMDFILGGSLSYCNCLYFTKI